MVLKLSLATIYILLLTGCGGIVQPAPKTTNAQALLAEKREASLNAQKIEEYRQAEASKQLIENLYAENAKYLDCSLEETLQRIRSSKNIFGKYTDIYSYTSDEIARDCAKEKQCIKNVEYIKNNGSDAFLIHAFAGEYKNLSSMFGSTSPKLMAGRVVAIFGRNWPKSTKLDPSSFLRGDISYQHSPLELAAGEYALRIMRLYYTADEQAKIQNIAEKKEPASNVPVVPKKEVITVPKEKVKQKETTNTPEPTKKDEPKAQQKSSKSEFDALDDLLTK